MKKIHLLAGFLLLLTFQIAFSQPKSVEYKLLKKIPVKGNGSWDYLTIDNNTSRLFIAHGDVVEVLDLKTEKIVGQILKTPGVHGIACAHEFNKGYITSGKLDSVIVFDLTSLEVLRKIPTGKGPDGILFDPFSKRIFIFNGLGKSVTIVDPKTDQIAGTTELSGKPEGAVSDGKGTIFCNIEDKSSVVRFDAKSMKVGAEWPLSQGKGPTGLAIDLRNNRLLSACSKSKQLIVLNGTDGTVFATIPIGEGCDGAVFIPDDQTILTSNGDGTVTVIRVKDNNTYEVTQTISTQKGARTITYGRMTRKMYLPCAEVTIENGKKKITPGSFKILVLGK